MPLLVSHETKAFPCIHHRDGGLQLATFDLCDGAPPVSMTRVGLL